MRPKTGESKKVNPPAGVHVARLISILDYGKQIDRYAPDGRYKVEFVWELPEELHVFNEDKGEQPLVVDRKYGNTLGRGSDMKEIIEGMLGAKIGKDFELDSLKYKLCQLNLTLEQDGEYENVIIVGAMPLTKDQIKKKYPHFNDWILFDMDNFDQGVFDSIVQWKKDNIAKSETFKALEADGVAVNIKEEDTPKAPPAKNQPAKVQGASKASPFAAASKAKTSVKKR